MKRDARSSADYRAARARLKAHPTRCWRCGQRADTIDHVPPLAFHRHTGRACCELRPACARCNYADGARIANRIKARRRPATVSRIW